MMEVLPASQLIELPLACLQQALGAKARVFVAQTYRHALEGLFAGPQGVLVILSLGDEAPESDSLAGEQFEDIQILRSGITVTVAAPMAPTAAPNEGLYADFAGAAPFLDTLQRVKDELLAMRMPAEQTGVYWTYRGRTAVDVQGLPFPAYSLAFDIEVSPTPRATLADPTQDLRADPAELPDADLPTLGENSPDLPKIGKTGNDVEEP